MGSTWFTLRWVAMEVKCTVAWEVGIPIFLVLEVATLPLLLLLRQVVSTAMAMVICLLTVTPLPMVQYDFFHFFSFLVWLIFLETFAHVMFIRSIDYFIIFLLINARQKLFFGFV